MADHVTEQAARAIVELINSRPMSPRHEEIAAIIRKLGADGTSRERTSPAGHGLDEYGPDITKLP